VVPKEPQFDFVKRFKKRIADQKSPGYSPTRKTCSIEEYVCMQNT